MIYQNFRITTNGQEFRAEGQISLSSGGVQWVPLYVQMYGCASYGYGYEDTSQHFKTKQEAVEFLRKEFGEQAIRSLLAEWIPC